MNTQPRALIHLKAIASNWRVLDDALPAQRAGAVVKANGYGHGAVRTALALYVAGCRDFFVAYASEARQLREVLPGKVRLFVFNGTGDVRGSEGIIPVVNSMAELVRWKNGVGGTYAIHIDTGMNRLGIPMEELAEAVEVCGPNRPALVMSHLACADKPDHRQNNIQAAAFARVREAFPNVATSLANTAGHWLGERFGSDLSRPGIGLYGGGTSPLRSTQLQPGMTLEAPILQVRDVPAGQHIGYGATARLDSPRTVATVALGYGDGFPRSAGSKGFAYVGEVRCPIIGRISMDLITIDVSAAKGLAKPGDWAEFIGARAGLEDQASAAGTLGYELITGLGARVERRYTD